MAGEPLELWRLLRAYQRIDEAREKFDRALDAALSAGHTKSEIARTLGVSRQAVQKMAQRRR